MQKAIRLSTLVPPSSNTSPPATGATPVKSARPKPAQSIDPGHEVWVRWMRKSNTQFPQPTRTVWHRAVNGRLVCKCPNPPTDASLESRADIPESKVQVCRNCMSRLRIGF